MGEPPPESFAVRWARKLGNVRDEEYRRALRFLEGCDRVLDVGCGNGTFLRLDSRRFVGIDVNPDNVSYCEQQGLDARVGDALAIPYPDRSFDGVFCSHVFQVFLPDQVVRALREFGRVVRPGGVIVITTQNWFPRFFRHPENVRPYPPDALRRLFGGRGGASSPMFPGLPPISQEAIWLRRPPLIEFYSAASHSLDRVCGVLNRLQYVTFLRKYWTFDAYVVKFRVAPLP